MPQKIHIEMNKNYENLVYEVVKSINWSKLKHFHQVLGIKWQFEEKDGHLTERIPTIVDLKEELTTLLKFAIIKNTPYLDHGNWLIIWTDESSAGKQGLSGAKLEAIFSLEDSVAIDNQGETANIELLEKKLNEAIKNEKYEEAARYRDRLTALKK